MEVKKNENYDLEKKSPLFYSIGIVVALLCVTIAFEWKAPYDPINLSAPIEKFPEPFIVPITAIKQPEPPKPKVRKIIKPNLQEPIIIESDLVNELPQAENTISDIPFDDLISPEVIHEEIPEEPFLVVESMPEFPGGMEAFYKYISDHIQYPKLAKRLGVEGRITLQSVIDERGKATQIEVIKGIGAGCDEEAKRVLETLPLFKPGKQRGRAVKVKQVIPINFKLPY